MATLLMLLLENAQLAVSAKHDTKLGETPTVYMQRKKINILAQLECDFVDIWTTL